MGERFQRSQSLEARLAGELVVNQAPGSARHLSHLIWVFIFLAWGSFAGHHSDGDLRPPTKLEGTYQIIFFLKRRELAFSLSPHWGSSLTWSAQSPHDLVQRVGRELQPHSNCSATDQDPLVVSQDASPTPSRLYQSPVRVRSSWARPPGIDPGRPAAQIVRRPGSWPPSCNSRDRFCKTLANANADGPRKGRLSANRRDPHVARRLAQAKVRPEAVEHAERHLWTSRMPRNSRRLLSLDLIDQTFLPTGLGYRVWSATARHHAAACVCCRKPNRQSSSGRHAFADSGLSGIAVCHG